jgi:hypothetical protein
MSTNKNAKSPRQEFETILVSNYDTQLNDGHDQAHPADPRRHTRPEPPHPLARPERREATLYGLTGLAVRTLAPHINQRIWSGKGRHPTLWSAIEEEKPVEQGA